MYFLTSDGISYGNVRFSHAAPGSFLGRFLGSDAVPYDNLQYCVYCRVSRLTLPFLVVYLRVSQSSHLISYAFLRVSQFTRPILYVFLRLVVVVVVPRCREFTYTFVVLETVCFSVQKNTWSFSSRILRCVVAVANCSAPTCFLVFFIFS